MTFKHPGQHYLRTRNTIETIDDILAYADFLRKEAGVDGTLPVNLNAIFDHFGIPEPKTVPLPNLQGLLVDPERGIIVVNSNDPTLRQKFTKAHELAELLFSQIPSSLNILGQPNRPGGYSENAKESLCDWIAANLLMPPIFIKNHIARYGVTVDTARIVAAACEVSLTAALIQLVRMGSNCHYVILWRLKNKPTELKKNFCEGQLIFEGFGAQAQKPPKKLRVEWALSSLNSGYIPKDKSVDNGSLIFKAWESGDFTSGTEKLAFDSRSSFWYHTENLPFEIENEQLVLSLVEKLENYLP